MVCACKGDLFIEMKYFEFGKKNKELMILLHGGGTSYLGVLPTAKKIAEKYHVVLLAYDVSTRPSRRRSLRLWPMRLDASRTT